MRRTFTMLTGLAVTVFFVRSSAAHLANPYAFLSAVYSYKLVTPPVGLFIAAVLPFFQASVAICLLFRFFLPAAYASACLMFFTFACAQASVLYRGLNISCGCFGVAENNPITAYSLMFTVTLGTACLASSYLASDLGETNTDR